MSEETTDQANVEEPQGTDTTDWKAEARKWEKYAKENKAARDELDALKAAQMTEQEKLVKRAEEAEAALAAVNSKLQHAQDVADVAAKSGVPAQLLEFCADREAMEAFAQQYGANATPVHSAPSAPSTRLTRDTGKQMTNGEVFAELAEQLFTN